MKGRIKKLRLQSKAVEALRKRTQKMKEGENKRDKNKANSTFVISISASLKELQWRILPNDLSLKTSNTDEKDFNIRKNLYNKH